MRALSILIAWFSACAALHVPAPPALRPTARAPSPRCALVVDEYIYSPNVAITYCSRCNWLLRSTWLAQELLTTFNGTLAAVSLIPDTEGGVFTVTITGVEGEEQLVWNRAVEGRFPEAKELKQLVRDVIAPEQVLGHSDVDGAVKGSGKGEGETPSRGTGRKAVKRLWEMLRGSRSR
jgi:selenoprotein W-related protein